ncbi:PucR family transcriptional regulator [Nocardia salmonicida]|uniref:PucR family transcriptional regulator n=1 Tax=Nocardia salmonicida TaxID=53431 RepID=UPI0037B199DA
MDTTEISLNTPICVAGQPMGTWLTTHERIVTDRIINVLETELDLARVVPDDFLDTDGISIVVRTLRMMATMLNGRTQPGRHDLDSLRRWTVLRAEEGVALHEILAALQLGPKLIIREIRELAEPADLRAVMHACERLSDYLRYTVAAVAEAYLDERQVLFGQEGDIRAAAIDRLLRGEDGRTAATRAGLVIGDAYLMVRLSIGANTDGVSETPSAEIVKGRRLVKRLQAVFDRYASAPTLTRLDPSGGVAMLPMATSALASLDADPRDAQQLHQMLQSTIGARVTGAVVVVSPDEFPAGLQRTGEILELVRHSTRGPGLYRLSDVLLDYQLTRHTAATKALSSLLDAIADSPELVCTLEVYLTNGLNRRRTASVMSVHPNTVDNRLTRIRERTELDIANPLHIQQLGAALAARRALQLGK